MVHTRAEDTLPAAPSHLVVHALPSPGSTIGRYTVRDKVGSGGMGIVYRAHDPSLDREVAIKLVRPARLRGAAGAQHRARLLREARALAQLQHQNVIRIYDVGEHGDALFFAMEFVQGMDAAQWLQAEAPSWQRIVGVFRAAGRGLAAAHNAGLVHRDFKPANILVGDDNRVRVLDFGLARVAEDLRRATTHETPPAQRATTDAVTEAGIVVGTPAYMAPEQLAGLPADARSDQYSFCLSLWEALFDALPFEGSDAKALAAAKASGALRAPPPDGRVPPDLVAVLCRGLCADPGDRFGSMPDVLRQLRIVAERQSTPVMPVSPPRSTMRAAAPWLALGGGGVLAVALWAQTGDPAACIEDARGNELRAAFVRELHAARPEPARRVAADLAAHWNARGCAPRAADWDVLATAPPPD